MTPREGHSIDGFETGRSESVQLTGIKPKALHFASPVKSPVDKVFSTASTKERTASGQQDGSALGHHKAFGLSNCIYKCENANENDGSPEVEQFQGDKENSHQLKVPQEEKETQKKDADEKKDPLGEIATNTQFEIGQIEISRDKSIED